MWILTGYLIFELLFIFQICDNILVAFLKNAAHFSTAKKKNPKMQVLKITSLLWISNEMATFLKLLYKNTACGRLSPTNTITSNIQHNLIFIINFIVTAQNHGSFSLQTNRNLRYALGNSQRSKEAIFSSMEQMPFVLAPFFTCCSSPCVLSDPERLTPKVKGLTLG